MLRSALTSTTRRQFAAGLQSVMRQRAGLLQAASKFSTTSAAKAEGAGLSSLHTFSEDEQMMRDVVSRFAREVVQPKVSEMDENEVMDPAVIHGLFETGLMGVETPAELGGAGASFTSAVLTIEELAKIDPSVSALCDIHNTVVNTVFRTYGSKLLQEKYLPQLAQSKVG
ncbi:hypothetical protein GGI12_003649, partial [Dipsacomyces acuminosporus]